MTDLSEEVPFGGDVVLKADMGGGLQGVIEGQLQLYKDYGKPEEENKMKLNKTADIYLMNKEGQVGEELCWGGLLCQICNLYYFLAIFRV